MPITSDTGAGARGESVFVFAAVFLQRRELLLHLDHVPLGGADAFGAFALGARGGLLYDSRLSDRFMPLRGRTVANNWRSAFTASACPTRCFDGLHEEFLHRRPQLDGRVDARIAALLVGADGDEVAMLLVDGQRLAEAARELGVLGRDDLVHHAADRGFDVDRRIVAGFGDAPRQHDVAVEDGARRVGDRVLLVVAFGEHGVERGDRAAARSAPLPARSTSCGSRANTDGG